MTDRMKTQMDEFIAGDQYARALQSHNMTPVVDDDYPEVRHRYEAALRGLIEALRANGRIELSTPSAQSVERVAQPDGNYAVVLHPDFVDAQEAVDMARGGTTVILQKNIPPTPSAQADKARGEVERIGELIRTQDNRITSHPIFVVEQKRMHVAHPDYDHDRLVWVSGDGEATAEDAARLDAEYADTGETPDGWRQCAVGHSWEFVTACFTEQGCKDYLAANGHNLSETRIFVYSGWRNAEWQAIRAHLSTTPQPQGDATPSAQVSGGGGVIDRARALLADGYQRRGMGDELAAKVRRGAYTSHTEEVALEAIIAALSTPQARPDGVTYSSKQATECAGCGQRKHTPLRIDAMGGYVCLTCIDKKLGSLLGEFGYEQARPEGGEASEPVVTLTGYQLRMALNFLAPDRDDEQMATEVAIQWGPAREDDESRDEAGYFCWCVECPEEGSVRLDETPQPGRDGLNYEPSTHPTPAPDAVARLVEEMDQELEMFGAGAVAQLPTETLRDWRNRLAPFIAAQQEDKP